MFAGEYFREFRGWISIREIIIRENFLALFKYFKRTDSMLPKQFTVNSIAISKAEPAKISLHGISRPPWSKSTELGLLPCSYIILRTKWCRFVLETGCKQRILRVEDDRRSYGLLSNRHACFPLGCGYYSRLYNMIASHVHKTRKFHQAGRENITAKITVSANFKLFAKILTREHFPLYGILRAYLTVGCWCIHLLPYSCDDAQ